MKALVEVQRNFNFRYEYIQNKRTEDMDSVYMLLKKREGEMQVFI